MVTSSSMFRIILGTLQTTKNNTIAKSIYAFLASSRLTENKQKCNTKRYDEITLQILFYVTFGNETLVEINLTLLRS